MDASIVSTGAVADTLRPAWSRLAILAVYMLALGVAIFSHAMWGDEIQAWLIARDSANIPALYHNLHYEGHPALWYLLLMPLTRLSRDPVLMQALQFAIASATVGVVLWRAPLSALERALFPFGYFTFYEYAVKSRSYGLGFLLVVLFCALWPRRRHSPVLMAIILALMANTHILYMILSIAAAAALVADGLTGPSSPDEKQPTGWRWYGLAIAILCVAWAIAILTAIPPADAAMSLWHLGEHANRFEDAFSVLAALFSPSFSNWVAALAVPLLLAAFVRARANPPVLAFLAASMIGLPAFFYLTAIIQVWHRGLIYVAFFAVVWIDRLLPRIGADRSSCKPIVPTVVFAAILASQAVCGLAAVWDDLHRPLSNGRDAAKFIAAQGWAKDPLIGTFGCATGTIVGYLGIDRAYYADGRRWGSFGIKKREATAVDMGHFLADTLHFGPNTTLVASENTPLDRALLREYGFIKVADFVGAAIPNENYKIYRRSGASKVQGLLRSKD